ncbi:MAG: glycosyltransferase family 2 protein [Phocaeicola sp.]
MIISIVIPIYNVANYIEKCLLSALNQTYDKLEILLINDCTTDNSIELIQQLLENHPKANLVRIIHHEKNQGLSAARNTGIRAAKGDYIFFLDSDDYITNECIELQLNMALQNDSDMVLGDIKIEGDARTFKPWWDFSAIPSVIDSNDSIRNFYFENKLYMMAWNKLTKSKFIKENSLYFKEGIIHEDDLWMFESVLHLNRLSIVNHPTYNYLQREGSIMTTKNKKSEESKYIILNQCLNLTIRDNHNLTNYVVLRKVYYYIQNITFTTKEIELLKSNIVHFRKYYSAKDLCKQPIHKRVILMLPLIIPHFFLKNYYRIIGKLQQYNFIRL